MTVSKYLYFTLLIAALSGPKWAQAEVSSTSTSASSGSWGHFSSSGLAKQCFYPHLDHDGRSCSCNGESQPQCECEAEKVAGPICPEDNPQCQCCLTMTCHEDLTPESNRIGPLVPSLFSEPFPFVQPHQMDFANFIQDMNQLQHSMAEQARTNAYSSSFLTSSFCRNVAEEEPCHCLAPDPKCQCSGQKRCDHRGQCQCCLQKRCRSLQGLNEPVPNWFPSQVFDEGGFPFGPQNFFL